MTALSTPITEFLEANSGNYRIEREWGPVIPPNTWIYFHLSSPSGYDPLAILSYARWYLANQSDRPMGKIDPSSQMYTRYLESNVYNSSYFDLFGVKYLVAIKRDKEGRYDPNGDNVNTKIPIDMFDKLFSDGSLIILENKTVMSRAILYDKFYVEPDSLKAQNKMVEELNFRDEVVINKVPSLSYHKVSSADTADIIKYLPASVTIHTKTANSTILMLTDTYYPGWKVYLDNRESRLLLADGVYRAVEVPAGFHEVLFKYEPISFKLGLFTSIISVFTLILVILYGRQHDKISHKSPRGRSS
jgi:hypothetical protein